MLLTIVFLFTFREFFDFIPSTSTYYYEAESLLRLFFTNISY